MCLHSDLPTIYEPYCSRLSPVLQGIILLQLDITFHKHVLPCYTSLWAVLTILSHRTIFHHVINKNTLITY